MTTRLLEQDPTAWDQFVRNHPQSALYHLSKWRGVIQESFGHKTYYLYALEGDQIGGVFPLVLLKSLFFGTYLVSLPFFNYCGLLANTDGIRQELLEAAIQIAQKEKATHIEIRQIDFFDLGLPYKQNKVEMFLELPESTEKFLGAMKAKLRSQIKKPQKEGMITKIGKIPLLEDFYKVFAINMRDLGTPVYSRKFFKNILTAFDEANIAVVYYQNLPVGAGFIIGYKDVLEIPWASTIKDYNKLSPNMLLYFSVLDFAMQNHYKRFDFGRSTPEGGTYHFKKQWGAQPRQLYWHYYLKDTQELPELNPDNPKYQAAIKIWQKLPLFVTRWIGPHIVKNLP